MLNLVFGRHFGFAQRRGLGGVASFEAPQSGVFITQHSFAPQIRLLSALQANSILASKDGQF